MRTNGLILLPRWEYLRSLQVEGELISGRLPFRPSLVSSHVLFVLNHTKCKIAQDPLLSWADVPARFLHSAVSMETTWL